MRNRLLTLLSLFCMALVANAQDKTWEAPSPTRAPFVDVVENGKKYLIYNVETEAFMCNGLDWDTRTCVSPQYANQYLLETKQVINRATGKPRQGTGGWTIKTMSCTNNITKVLNKYVFIDGPAASYQDMASQGHNYFDIVPLGNGTYQIRAIASDDKYGKGVEGWDYDVYSFGVLLPEEGAEPATYTAVNPNGEAATHGVTWKFADATLYNTLVELYDLLEKNYAAQAADKVEDVSAFVAVYNNKAATLAELQAAIDGLNKAIHDKPFESLMDATEDDPVEITSMMVNADFSAGNANGWTNTFVGGTNATNVGYQGAKYENGDVKIEKFIEAWANADFSGAGYRSLGDGELSQTLKSMPAGKYMLTVDCISNQQDGRSNPAVGVELFCLSGEYESSQNLSTGNGAPEHFEVDFLCVGGDLTVGLRTKNATANWIAADNFRLYFKGAISPDENPAKIDLNSVIKSFSKWDPDSDDSDYEDLKANAEVLEAWEEILAAAKNATEDFKAVKEGLQAAAAALEASIADYKKFAASIEACKGKEADLRACGFADVAGELSDMRADEWKDAYDDGSYTSEDIAKVDSIMYDIITKGVSESMEAGQEVTCLLNNPGFDKDFSGWAVSGATPAWGGNGVWEGVAIPNTVEGGLQGADMGSGVAEVYHAKFDISQVIKNMPKGVYTVSCQAFERDDNGAGIETVLYAIVDGKEQNAPLKTLTGDSSPVQLFVVDPANAKAWQSDKENDVLGGYMPNGMTGANIYFAQGFYKNKFCFILDEPADVTIGVKTESAGDWVLFDDFKIVFEGDAIDPLLEVLQNLCDEVTTVYSSAEESQSATNYALNAISEALVAAEAADASSVETLQAAYKELSGAYDEFQKNIASLKTFLAASQRLTFAADTLMLNPDYVRDPEAIAKNSELQDIIVSEAYADYATAELDTCVKQIDELIAVMKKWESFQLYIAEEAQFGSNEQGAFLTDGEKYLKAVEDEALVAEYEAAKATLKSEGYTTVTEELDDYKAELQNLVARMQVWYNYGEAKKRTLPEGWESASDDNLIEFTEAVMVNANLNKGADQGWLFTKKDCQNGPRKDNGPIDGSNCMEFWNPTAAGYGFDFSQTLFCLPEGRYMLWVTAIISKNGEEVVAAPVEEGEGHYNCAKLYAHLQNGEAEEWHATPILNAIDENPDEEMAATGDHDYCVYFDVPAAAADAPRGVEVTVGVKSSGKMPGRWIVADDFQLIYYGKASSKPVTDADAIAQVSAASVVNTTVYSLDGSRQSRLQRGVNIIKTTLADGTVRVAKVLVK